MPHTDYFLYVFPFIYSASVVGDYFSSCVCPILVKMMVLNASSSVRLQKIKKW